MGELADELEGPFHPELWGAWSLTNTPLQCSKCDVGSNECPYIATDDEEGCISIKVRFSTYWEATHG